MTGPAHCPEIRWETLLDFFSRFLFRTLPIRPQQRAALTFSRRSIDQSLPRIYYRILLIALFRRLGAWRWWDRSLVA